MMHLQVTKITNDPKVHMTRACVPPADTPAPPKAPPISNDRRDTEGVSTATSRRSSAVESGGTRDLSGLTQKDPVPPPPCKSF